MNWGLINILILVLYSAFATTICADDVLFVAEMPVPSEYTVFANTGWDGNWYIGHRHSWVKKLPKLDIRGYDQAYIGASLGRSKERKSIIEYHRSKDSDFKEAMVPEAFDIYIGLSSSQRERPKKKLLVTTKDIPLEGSLTAPRENTGSSIWFWTDIDINHISEETDNYIHIWSDDPLMESAKTAPILAAAIGSSKLQNSFLYESSNSIKNISYFEPALAIKLINSRDLEMPSILIKEFSQHPVREMHYNIITDVKGKNISSVGLEIYLESQWKHFGKAVFLAPYDLLYDSSRLKPSTYQLRAYVVDWAEQRAYSQEKTFTTE